MNNKSESIKTYEELQEFLKADLNITSVLEDISSTLKDIERQQQNFLERMEKINEQTKG